MQTPPRSYYYRRQGLPSDKSMLFIDSLEKQGWPKDYIEQFSVDIARYESFCIRDCFEEGLLIFITPPPKSFYPFLRELEHYIKVITRAQRMEALIEMAGDTRNKSLAAQAEKLLHKMGL